MVKLLILILILPVMVMAQTNSSVELRWDHVTTYNNMQPLRPETLAVRKYAVYHGQSARTSTVAPGGYPQRKEEIIQNTTTISGLQSGTHFYASASAYYFNENGFRVESALSNEVHAIIPLEPDDNILASPVIVYVKVCVGTVCREVSQGP